MRIAWFSPLPPQATGIADYSAELLPALQRHLDVDLFLEPGCRPQRALTERFPVFPLQEYRRRAGRYDLALYQLGNNPEFHGGIYRALLEHPGVVVLHEYMLHHLVRGLSLAGGNPTAYLEEMRYAYGTTGSGLARRALDTGTPLDIWSYPLFERAVDASLGVLVHNRTTRDRLLASRPAALVEVVPHHLSLEALPAQADTAAFRQHWGVPAGAPLVASFGLVTPQKRVGTALAAFARLRREVPEARYLLIGEVSPHYDLEGLLARHGREGVVVTGRVELPELLLAMAACDVAVNLRHPSGGETSGTCIRLLGLGRPVIVSEHGWFAEIPDDCCAKVALDELEEELLAASLVRLASDPALRRAMGENARRHMAEHHSLAGSVGGYVRFLERVGAGVEPPLRPAPPLLPLAADDVAGRLAAELGRELADLGIDERDPEGLERVAGAVVELGLDPERGEPGR